ncbi:MAG: hypothetical protein HOD60_02925 [Candidatus Nitrosopelagicus sp.]|nr:hypothetical protein [Candidatus Nitrosopelagicus sp.]
MSQESKPWVLVSSMNKDTNPQDLQRIAPQVSILVDEWQSKGKIMWSGAFDNERSSMAVFEATEDEAKEFFKKYESICSGVLNYYLHQWDAMPILSVLSN